MGGDLTSTSHLRMQPKYTPTLIFCVYIILYYVMPTYTVMASYIYESYVWESCSEAETRCWKKLLISTFYTHPF